MKMYSLLSLPNEQRIVYKANNQQKENRSNRVWGTCINVLYSRRGEYLNIWNKRECFYESNNLMYLTFDSPQWSPENGIWIGASDTRQEGIFAWSDGSKMDYSSKLSIKLLSPVFSIPICRYTCLIENWKKRKTIFASSSQYFWLVLLHSFFFVRRGIDNNAKSWPCCWESGRSRKEMAIAYTLLSLCNNVLLQGKL